MLSLFFVADLPTTVGSTYQFGGDEAAHAIRVLRTQVGDSLALSSGQGAWSVVKVLTLGKKDMTVQVLSTGFEEALPVEFHVAQALTKGDRIKESIELNKKSVTKVYPKDGAVAIRIGGMPNIMFGRHFDETNQICSWQTRKSIDALKEFFRNELTMEDWKLIKVLKEKYKIE